MIIIPAIDILDGKVVRLTRGDPAMSKVYSEDPLEVAQRWVSEGARLLHVVDLSAALGNSDNSQIIKRIVKAVKIKIQTGGGIRDLKKAEALLSSGVERIIIGTKGLDEEFLEEALSTFGNEKVGVSADVVNSCLAIEGWKKKTTLKGLDFINDLKSKGVKWIIYTDISRDGTLSGPNLSDIEMLSSVKDINLIFSGGISSVSDLREIRKRWPNLWGVIVGKALYEGNINLPEAMRMI